MRQRLAPPFHLAESQIRPEPGRLYKATEHRLPPTSSTCCSFVNSHRPPGAVVLADRSADPHLVNLVNAMSNDDDVEAIACSHLPIMEFFGNRCRNALTPTCPRMALVHHAKLPNFPYRPTMILSILVERSGNVAAETHLQHSWDAFVPADTFQSRLNRRGGLDLRQPVRALPAGTARWPHR